jgi:hypothetical protein
LEAKMLSPTTGCPSPGTTGFHSSYQTTLE